MSYAEDIRGALAATSGASRRVLALRDLGLPEEREQAVQDFLDTATDALIQVSNILRDHGYIANGSNLITASAGQDKGWRETVYGGKKEAGTTTKVMGRSKSSKAKSAPPASAPELDVSHPWRSE